MVYFSKHYNIPENNNLTRGFVKRQWFIIIGNPSIPYAGMHKFLAGNVCWYKQGLLLLYKVIDL
jgi:hypothetical protein